MFKNVSWIDWTDCYEFVSWTNLFQCFDGKIDKFEKGMENPECWQFNSL